jgi:type IV fimbrial biogenesis protein FimT
MVVAQRRRVVGFTLIEMLVVLTVVVLLTVAAAPSFSDIVARHRVKSAATDLYFALAKARSEAVKRNANVTVSPQAGGWQSGWQILDASNAVLESHGAVTGASITGGPASLVYLSSGRVQGNAAAGFLITGLTASSSQRCVLAALSGRPYVKSAAC